jgi:hypothetical protein
MVAGLLVEQEGAEGAEVSGNASYEKKLSRNESRGIESRMPYNFRYRF